MAVTDWDTTAANNTSVDGVSLAEGWSPASVNNAIRGLMAEVAAGIAAGDFAEITGLQTEDATLTALAALTIANGKLIKGTGADAFSMIDISSYGETLINLANAGALAAQISAVTVTSATLAATGHIALDTDGDASANIKFNWGTGTFGTPVSFNSAFATACWGVIPFPTSLINQGDESDEHMYVSTKSVSGFTARFSGDWNSLPSLFYIAIGV